MILTKDIYNKITSPWLITKLIAALWILLSFYSLFVFITEYIDKHGLGEISSFTRSFTRTEVSMWMRTVVLITGSIGLFMAKKWGWLLFQYIKISTLMEVLLFSHFIMNEEWEISEDAVIFTTIQAIIIFIYLSSKRVRDYLAISKNEMKMTYILFAVVATLLYFMPIAYYYGDTATSETMKTVWMTAYYAAGIALVSIIAYYFIKVFSNNQVDTDSSPMKDAIEVIENQQQLKKAQMPWFRRIWG